jgi:hypothetical protein
MGKALKHAAISVVLGVTLAVCAWLAWWLASMALGAEAWEQAPALALALGVGAVAAAVGAMVVTLLNRSPGVDAEARTPGERLGVESFQN